MKAHLEIDFAKPVPVGPELEATASLTRPEGSRWYVDAELRLAVSQAVLARGTAILVERDPAHFERHRQWLADQQAAATQGD